MWHSKREKQTRSGEALSHEGGWHMGTSGSEPVPPMRLEDTPWPPEGALACSRGERRPGGDGRPDRMATEQGRPGREGGGQKQVHRRGARVQGRREQVPGRGTPRGGEVSGHLTVTPSRETTDIIQKEGIQDLT